MILSLLLLATVLLQGCRDIHENPNYPNAIINITINLNQIDYYDLRVVSGYTYLTSDPMSTSRGLIVYRLSQDEFRAYDRLPPNEPNACCDAATARAWWSISPLWLITAMTSSIILLMVISSKATASIPSSSTTPASTGTSYISTTDS